MVAFGTGLDNRFFDVIIYVIVMSQDPPVWVSIYSPVYSPLAVEECPLTTPTGGPGGVMLNNKIREVGGIPFALEEIGDVVSKSPSDETKQRPQANGRSILRCTLKHL